MNHALCQRLQPNGWGEFSGECPEGSRIIYAEAGRVLEFKTPDGKIIRGFFTGGVAVAIKPLSEEWGRFGTTPPAK